MRKQKTSLPLRFDPGLVEEAVFRAIHTRQVGSALAARVLARRSEVYELPPELDRDAAFRAVAMEAFRGLDLDLVFRQTLDEFPLLAALEEMRVLPARSKSEEHAELFVKEGNGSGATVRRGAIWVLVKRFLEPQDTQLFLRRELLHISDMLDERFAYRPDSVPGGRPPALQNLFRDRYRLLWELSVLGRLQRRSGIPAGYVEGLRSAFDRAFVALQTERRDDVFRRVVGEDHPTHTLLVELADRACEPAGGEPGAGQFSGAGSCPLCGFTSFDWVEEPQSLTTGMLDAIREAAPSWRPEQGICRRCHEVFESRMRFSQEQDISNGVSV